MVLLEDFLADQGIESLVSRASDEGLDNDSFRDLVLANARVQPGGLLRDNGAAFGAATLAGAEDFYEKSYRVMVVHPDDVAGMVATSAYARALRIPMIVSPLLGGRDFMSIMSWIQPSDIFVVGGLDYYADEQFDGLEKSLSPGSPANVPPEDPDGEGAPARSFGVQRIAIPGESSDVAVAELLFSALRPRVAVVIDEAEVDDPGTVIDALDASAVTGTPIYIEDGELVTVPSLQRADLNGLLVGPETPDLSAALRNDGGIDPAGVSDVVFLERDIEGLPTRLEEVDPRPDVDLGILRSEELYRVVERGEPHLTSEGEAICNYYSGAQIMGLDAAQQVRIEEVGVAEDSCKRVVEINVSALESPYGSGEEPDDGPGQAELADFTGGAALAGVPPLPAANVTYESGSISSVDEPAVKLCQRFEISPCFLDPTSRVHVYVWHKPTPLRACTHGLGHGRSATWLNRPGFSVWVREKNVIDTRNVCAESWIKVHQKFRNQEFRLRPLCSAAPDTTAHHWPTFARAVPTGYSEHVRNTSFGGRCDQWLSAGWHFLPEANLVKGKVLVS